MDLAKLEGTRGYPVGVAAKVREKLGLPVVSEVDAIANIEARIKWEKYIPCGDGDAKFAVFSMPKTKWKK